MSSLPCYEGLDVPECEVEFFKSIHPSIHPSQVARDGWMDGKSMCKEKQKRNVQSQWEEAPTSKSLKFFKYELDVYDYVREIYTSANFHFNPFSGGFSPDR